jgi:hypothetical protein
MMDGRNREERVRTDSCTRGGRGKHAGKWRSMPYGKVLDQRLAGSGGLEEARFERALRLSADEIYRTLRSQGKLRTAS